ncbi:hypothetical protein C8K30_111147 [Promicromonospora sp. AC04]|nr:hypothetical protein C8K30_111147 [Promicromonospora sp. AC04]
MIIGPCSILLDSKALSALADDGSSVKVERIGKS